MHTCRSFEIVCGIRASFHCCPITELLVSNLAVIWGNIIPQMDKKMENEIETGTIGLFAVRGFSFKSLGWLRVQSWGIRAKSSGFQVQAQEAGQIVNCKPVFLEIGFRVLNFGFRD